MIKSHDGRILMRGRIAQAAKRRERISVPEKNADVVMTRSGPMENGDVGDDGEGIFVNAADDMDVDSIDHGSLNEPDDCDEGGFGEGHDMDFDWVRGGGGKLYDEGTSEGE